MVRLFTLLCAFIGIGGSAFAADLPPSPPRAPAVYVPAVVPVYNWTGFYIGGNVGAAWTQGHVSDSAEAVVIHPTSHDVLHDEWEANAKVASVSPVPIMLDEPICALADVERAGSIKNIGFCKLKLKRFGGLNLVREALDAVRAHGMEPVLGDGLGIELGCWMEGCVARVTIRNAGEFNGFLKPRVRLLTEPLQFSAGELVLSPGFRPLIDRDILAAHETARERFALATALQIGN